MLKFSRIPVLIFSVVIFLFPWIAQSVPAISHYTDILVFAGLYCLITIGLSLLMGYAGQISLGHAAFFGLGAYFSGVLTTRYGWNPWMVMVAGTLFTSIIAGAVGWPALKLKGHYLAMATLAFGIIVVIIFNEEIEITGGPDGLTRIPGLKIMGFAFNTVERYYYLVWTLVLAIFLFTANLIQSGIGRALRALHSSESAAMAMGVDAAKYKLLVFIYSGALASLAGSLYAHYLKFINPSTFNIFFGIKLLIMIALGGMNFLWGSIIGAIIISFLSYEWLQYFEELEILVYGGILLVFTVFAPGGLAAIPHMILEKVRTRK
ncbi:MAG: branched-chain amino acid ABC transporter permease [Proteobacteria bacterium]|nr:branched-chain amino acid ABC transporter permease [Pseudomonadota bacterium]MBU4470744.1 branched-chain amino acid ABC transporter permease [Pseudomonadota bacterium]MCG2751528.1 branched-chain amino acid ABC transporter permease [Desulfobacteraceae bacterium]